MLYKNTVTGTVIDTVCQVSGGDWVVYAPEKETEHNMPSITGGETAKTAEMPRKGRVKKDECVCDGR